jgi:hypothetical protein
MGGICEGFFELKGVLSGRIWPSLGLFLDAFWFCFFRFAKMISLEAFYNLNGIN